MHLMKGIKLNNGQQFGHLLQGKKNQENGTNCFLSFFLIK